jgi:hypothetical protein
MSQDKRLNSQSMALPAWRLCVGCTGHRPGNRAFAENQPAIAAALASLCESLDRAGAAHGAGRPRLYSLLARGADMMAMEQALERGWDVVAPLPFGLDLNIAINAGRLGEADARAVIDGVAPADPAAAAAVAEMHDLAGRIHLFELAEQDALVSAHFLAALRAPDSGETKERLAVLASDRVAVAGRIMVEQSDLLIAVWDGDTSGAVGGTRHSMAAALHQGVPVLWIDATAPERIRILEGPDALDRPPQPEGAAAVAAFLDRVAAKTAGSHSAGAIRLHAETWHARSRRRFLSYRRIESLFGGEGRTRFADLRRPFETPDGVLTGSAAPFLAEARSIPGADAGFVERIGPQVFSRFAWADGLSTYLSDAYRGGMVVNFLLSALAIITGVAYLPMVEVAWKWAFTLAELLLLLAIVAITAVGRRQRWHGRWLETRRVAEYLRHGPILLLLGVARPAGAWPRGAENLWPEDYARHVLRSMGLPRIAATELYLRTAVATLLLPHVLTQRDYHRAKARRLHRAHHALDRASEALFILAIASVATYLLLTGAGAIGLIAVHTGSALAKLFTFLGVALPALGGALAGIRYFGDFERFADISRATAEKLDVLRQRIESLLAGGALRYAQAAQLAHAMDEIVVGEIENWQSVFSTKNIAVPV